MPNNLLNRSPHQSGNILLYILGAIALLGLLIIIVRGSNSSGGNTDEETMIIHVSEIQDYGRELETAVNFIFKNGHSEADIRFAHPDANVGYGIITDEPTRQVFSRQGGGAVYRDIHENVQTVPTDIVFSGANNVPEVGTASS